VLCKATAGELRAALQELYLNDALPTPVIHATNADIGSILSGGLIPGGPQGSRDMVHFATEFPDSTPLRVLREEQAGPVGDTAAPVARRITEALPGSTQKLQVLDLLGPVQVAPVRPGRLHECQQSGLDQ